MTVSYTGSIATARFGAFLLLLFRWTGSVYKLIWRELIVFVGLYVGVALIYRNLLNLSQQSHFEAWACLCEHHVKVIPMAFMIGIYVDIAFIRWTKVFAAIRSPDRACFCVHMAVRSNEYDVVRHRRAIARYLNLAQVLVLRDISTSVKSRYPTLNAVQADGFITPYELNVLEKFKGENKLEKYRKYWLVIRWALESLGKIYKKEAVRSKYLFSLAVQEILEFRESLGTLLGYDWISLPLAYTQVVTMVVCAHSLTSAMRTQYLYKKNNHCDVATPNTPTISATSQWPTGLEAYRNIQEFFPIFPFIEFIFYMGWLKIGESILNPFGMDDDDFETNYIMDRNLAVSYAIVDSAAPLCPEGTVEPTPLLRGNVGSAVAKIDGALNGKTGAKKKSAPQRDKRKKKAKP